MIECEFCKNCFSNKSNLKIHQKTVKYCLKIQGKDEKKDEKNRFGFYTTGGIPVSFTSGRVDSGFFVNIIYCINSDWGRSVMGPFSRPQ